MEKFDRKMMVLVLNSWKGDFGKLGRHQNVQRLNDATIPTFSRLVEGNLKRHKPDSQFVHIYIDGRKVATLYPSRRDWRLSPEVEWLIPQVATVRKAKKENVEGIGELLNEFLNAISELDENEFEEPEQDKRKSFGSLEEAVNHIIEKATEVDKLAFWPLVMEKDKWIVDPKMTEFVSQHKEPFTTLAEAAYFVRDHAEKTKVIEASIISPGERFLPPRTTY